MLVRQYIVGHMKECTYLLVCEESGQAVVVDPGGDGDELLRFIRERHLRVAHIVITHNHPDHTRGNRRIVAATGAEVVMHRADRDLLAGEAAVAFFRRLDFPSSDAPPPDRLAEHGDTIVFGNLAIEVIHTPGHSPGSICLLGAGHLFTGDSLFVGAAGRVDLPGGDFRTLMDSLEKRLAPLPDETTVWPGHDYGDTRSSTIGREKRENPYLGGQWP